VATVSDFLVFVLLGILMVALGVPLWTGRVRRNIWYGVRLSRTLRERQAYLRANAAFGRALVIGGIVVAVAAGAGTVAGATLDDEIAILVVMGLMAASIVIGVTQALLTLRRR
jgi:hypothetical protein